MVQSKFFVSIVLFVLLTACSTAPPQNIENICSVFMEYRDWYEAAVTTKKRWGIPVNVTMAFIHQESKYQAKIKPERTKILWIIPGPRSSSAFGYAQALDETWEEYTKVTGNWGASRSDFEDAADFIGWFNARSVKMNKIKPHDAYHLYLAYHEGQGGFKRKTYKNKKWLRNVAKKVKAKSVAYKKQYAGCKDELERSWLMRLLF